MAPVFLLIGVHPGSGRIIAMRWVEMLVGTLLRQAVLALVLGVLVYGYALIISTAMPWGMQVMFMALLTIAVFFYRRPFQHLFASMDGHTLTTRMLGEAASAPTLQRAAGVLPPVAAARAGRWGMRKAEPLLQAAAVAGGAGAGAAAAVAQGRVRGQEDAAGTPSGARVPVTAQPAPLDTDAKTGGRRAAAGRPVTTARPGAAPPLNLSGNRTAGGAPPTRSGGSGASGGSGGWFGGRAGGWAPRGGSGSGGGGSAPAPSGGRSSSGGGGRSGGGIFGGSRGSSGSGPRGSSAGSRNGGGSRSSTGSGGGIFGGSRSSSGSRGPSGSGGSIFGGGSRSSSGGASGSGGADRPSEAPPLWLPSRSDRGRRADEAPTPFWLRPSGSDKD
jgi:hypothetical protein